MPIHLNTNGRVCRSARLSMFGRQDRGLLGQRPAGVVLGQPESGVLLPPSLAYQGRRHGRHRRLDRTGLQPPPPPLSVEHAHPSTVRTAPPSHGTSRLTNCPPTGVKPMTREETDPPPPPPRPPMARPPRPG